MTPTEGVVQAYRALTDEQRADVDRFIAYLLGTGIDTLRYRDETPVT